MISVIIPVYNVEKYIYQCLDSVVGQTYSNLEIILVDDGSTDNSGCICDEYAKKDNRIKVIHKENGGLSSARNVALDIATGEYIAFVDSDDYLSLNTYEKCLEKLLETSADVCMFSHFTTNGTEHTAHKLGLEREFYCKEEIRDIILPKFFGKIKIDEALEGFVWRQVFRRNIIGNLRFRSEREYFAEDVVFDLELYSKGVSLCVINEPLYFYRYVEASLSNKYRENLFDKLQNLLSFMTETAESVGLDNVKERILNRAYIFAIFACRNIKNGVKLTKKQKIQGIKEIAQSPYVIEALKVVGNNGIKAKIFSWLLKKKSARLILLLI